MSTVAIIGAGAVGQALAAGATRAGRKVVFGVRDTAKASEATQGVSVLPINEAIGEAGIVVLAVPYDAALEIAQAKADWDGRILVDPTNPLKPDFSGLVIGTTTSAGEEISHKAKGARVVKAFNSAFAETYADPNYAGGKAFTPVCGDDPDAVAAVVQLANDMGLDGVTAGPLAVARYTEPFGLIGVALVYGQGHSREFAFTRVGRKS